MNAGAIPAAIRTGCPELDLVWAKFAARIISRPGVVIADTEDDLNWHAFLGHSIDMQGFRAAEFSGADPLSRAAPRFVPLRDRGIGIPELAELWHAPRVRSHLLTGIRGKPLDATLDVLTDEGGVVGKSLADAFRWFPFRKGHWSVRALLQNSSSLAATGYSFRRWLARECEHLGAGTFPPGDFRAVTPGGGSTIEGALRQRLEQTFYMVGPAIAPYMICDWQLGLWAQGRTSVFESFKWDSFQDQFVARYGTGIVPADEKGFVRWWLGLYPELPPRLANECIWLGTEHGLV